MERWRESEEIIDVEVRKREGVGMEGVVSWEDRVGIEVGVRSDKE